MPALDSERKRAARAASVALLRHRKAEFCLECDAPRAMSQQNVDALKAAYEAFARADLDAAVAIMDPEIAVTDHDRALDSLREYRGPQGVVQMAMQAAESFAEHRYEPEDFREAGDRVVVSVRRRGRGNISGIEVDEAQWHVWDFREGKAVRLRTFVSRRDALEAAGLSE